MDGEHKAGSPSSDEVSSQQHRIPFVFGQNHRQSLGSLDRRGQAFCIRATSFEESHHVAVEAAHEKRLAFLDTLGANAPFIGLLPRVRREALLDAPYFVIAMSSVAAILGALAVVKIPQWAPTGPSPSVAFHISSMASNIHMGRLRARMMASASL